VNKKNIKKKHPLIEEGVIFFYHKFVNCVLYNDCDDFVITLYQLVDKLLTFKLQAEYKEKEYLKIEQTDMVQNVITDILDWLIKNECYIQYLPDDSFELKYHHSPNIPIKPKYFPLHIDKKDALFFMSNITSNARKFIVDNVKKIEEELLFINKKGEKKGGDGNVRPKKFQDILCSSLCNKIIKKEERKINCTLFSPQKVKIDDSFFIQIFIHFKDKVDEVENSAKFFDDNSLKKGQTNLENVKKGDQISFYLSIKDIKLKQPVQRLVWQEITSSIIFDITIPKDFSSKFLIGKVIIVCARSCIPMGHINFKLDVVNNVDFDYKLKKKVFAKWYKKIFVSYCRSDLKKVLYRVQMLHLLEINFFQDIFMRSGAKWEKEIFKNIETSDAFFLFWSMAANNSSYVRKEYIHALEINKVKNIPEILPVIIEYPPPKPPLELQHLHFDDIFGFYLH